MRIKPRPKLHRDWIHPEAFKITQNLQTAGFKTYLVGGCVRDLLSGIPPKDFDIATMAQPREVKKTLHNAFIIGRRFKLVLAKRGEDQFEITTFRREAREDEVLEDDHPEGDNIFGSPEEDAVRRDFTINGLFYDPVQDELVDYCNGLQDIESHTIRMIGDPDARLIEDPIRILRAIRLSHKLDFTLDPHLRKAIVKNAGEIKRSVLPRKREEILKILRLNNPSLAFLDLYDLGVLEHISPTLFELYQNPEALKDFNFYLRKIHSFVIDRENPMELYGYFSLAYYRSFINNDPETRLTAEDILKNDRLKLLLREELGMYNVEQTITAKALELQHRLQQTQKFDLKKPDQKKLFIQNDAFPLALMLSKADYSLSGDQILYWERALKEFYSRPAERQRRPPQRRRRRN